MQIGYDFLVFKNPVICKKNFQIPIIFIEINVNVCLLCDHHKMKAITLHTRRTNCLKKTVTHLVFMYQLIFISYFEELKRHFSRRSISHSMYVLKSFRCLEVNKHVWNWNKVKKKHLREYETSIMPIGITYIHKQINVTDFINKLSFICLLWI